MFRSENIFSALHFQLTKAVVAKQENLQSTFDELFAAEKFAETHRQFWKLGSTLHDNSENPAVHSKVGSLQSMQPGQDRGNSGLIDTAHIFPGICASLRVAWISHGSADRLHVREAFQLRRKMPRLDAAGWLQLGSSASCLGAVARLRLPGPGCYLGPRSLSFLHRFGIRLVPLGTRPDCHPGRALYGWHRTEKVLGFEMGGHVAFGRVPSERERQM